MTSSTKTIRVQLPNGAIAFVEATQLSPSYEEEVADHSLTNKFDLADISGALEGIAALVSDALVKVKPKKATMELGIKVGIEAGQLTALVVKGTGEANLKIALEW